MTNEELGQAYKAFQAFNLNYKSTRIEEFDPERWIKVVKAITTGRVAHKKTGGPRSGSTWTDEQRKKHAATVKARQEIKLNGKQPNSRAGWVKLAEHKP